MPKLKPILSSFQPKIDLPRVFLPFLKPYRFKIAWGGRGSGKSYNFAQLMIMWALMEEKPCVYLCCREIQKSIDNEKFNGNVCIYYNFKMCSF